MKRGDFRSKIDPNQDTSKDQDTFVEPKLNYHLFQMSEN